MQHDSGKHIYTINTKMILEMDGDCWDMLNQIAALKYGYTKMTFLFYQCSKDAVCNSGRQNLLIFTHLQVKRNTILFNVSYIASMTIHGLAQYQAQMIAEFVITDKIEVSLVIKAAYSDTGNQGSILNVVTLSLRHLW